MSGFRVLETRRYPKHLLCGFFPGPKRRIEKVIKPTVQHTCRVQGPCENLSLSGLKHASGGFENLVRSLGPLGGQGGGG